MDATDGGVLARFEAFLAATADDIDDQLLPDRLCQALVKILTVDGAGISVYLGADAAVPVGASDAQAAMGEALQFTAGEGPCMQAYTTGRPVLIPDIHAATSPARTRWPTYTGALTHHTAYRAAYAYPLTAHTSTLGSLSVYQRTNPHTSGAGQTGRSARSGDVGPNDVGPGDVGPGDVGADVAVMGAIADRITGRLLQSDTFPSPQDGVVGPGWLDSPTGLRRQHVWTAQGQTAQAANITPGQAIALLRAQAFTTGRLLDDLAEDIATGHLPPPTLNPTQ